MFAKVLYGKVFADRGYVKQELFESLFDQGIQFVLGLKAKMKNKFMPMWDKIMLRKRYIFECINELLKNKANLVHSRHRSIHNFIMNLCSALTAYCFLRISRRHCLYMWKNQGSSNYLHNKLIPNWRIICMFAEGFRCKIILRFGCKFSIQLELFYREVLSRTDVMN